MLFGSSNISLHMKQKLLAILPTISGAHDPKTPGGLDKIDLSVAENILLRNELLAFCKDAIAEDLKPESLSYPRGFGGEPALLDALASFFNTYFHPSNPVKTEHIVTTSGAGNALDAILFSICDDGDSVLVPGPYWEGFNPYFRIHANVNTIVVNTPTFAESLTSAVVTALQAAYSTAPERLRIKALVLTNPHNPFAQCYPAEVLRECLRFCHTYGLHLISDEVYAMSCFDSSPALPPFVSALSLLDNFSETDMGEQQPREVVIDPSRVHVIWSMSKDFGCSGLRMGCVISQANKPLLLGVGLSAYWQTSALTSVFATALLTSPKLPGLMELNSKRLTSSYLILTEALKKWGAEFIPANAGLFVFAKLGNKVTGWEEEMAVVKLLEDGGVIVSPGKRFNGAPEEKGWVRITFAVPQEVLEEAVRRIETCLPLSNCHGVDIYRQN